MPGWILVLAVLVALYGPAFTQEKPVAATCPGNASGYFEGTAVSQQAGKLNVSLNLKCDSGRYGGGFVTPVGKFDVTSGQVQGTTLVLDFSAGTDTGKLYVDRVGNKLEGKFVFGDDSGPVEIVRLSDAKAAGYDVPTLSLTPAQWREDLQYFAVEVPKEHANAFYHLSRDQFNAAITKADGELGSASGDAAYVILDRIANAIGDGHTFVMWPDDVSHFPLDIATFDGEYRVAGVRTGDERALGGRIISIDSVPLEKVLATLQPMTPAAETKTLGDIRIEDFLTIGLLLHGTGIIRDRDVATYLLKDSSGKEFSLTLHAVVMAEYAGLKWVRPFHEQPLYLQNRPEGLWCKFLESSSTMYCSFRNYDNLQQNSRTMLGEICEHQPKKLAIDMRFNLGGDYTLGEKDVIEPIRALSEINRPGHLFVLISPYTFSAGMSNAAQFRSQTKAILVGQTIGERPNSYQEAREIRLPNSHLVVRVSTKYYSFASGENLIRPDKEILRTWRDYKSGRDAILDWVEEH